MVISTIANIANRDQVSTYISQVTENHPTFTGLSIDKHMFDPGPTICNTPVLRKLLHAIISMTFHIIHNHIW
jgi:hypothetical protein